MINHFTYFFIFSNKIKKYFFFNRIYYNKKKNIMNEIKKVILEKAIQNLDTNHIKQIFKNYSMVASI